MWTYAQHIRDANDACIIQADLAETSINQGCAGENWVLLNAGLGQLCNAVKSSLGGYCGGIYGHWPVLAFHYLYTYMGGEPYDLTMADILSAMVKADPDEVMYFVGLVDAYRQSIWGQPFNQEFFAALARGFEQWP